MAEEAGIPLLNSADEYVELFKLVRAYDYIYKHAAELGVGTVVTRTSESGETRRRVISAEDLKTFIIENHGILSTSRLEGSAQLYSSKPSEEEIIRAMNNSLKLSGEENWNSALRSLRANEDLLKSSYQNFKQNKQTEFETLEDNVAVAKQTVADSKKINRKQKRRRFWATFGKVATATITAALAGGYVMGAFGLAGGFAGLASISTMPFATLALVGGVLLYNVGKLAVKKIWSGLSNVITKANEIIKGKDDVLGSNKNLKQAKALEKQNKKALSNVRGRLNALSPHNMLASDIFNEHIDIFVPDEFDREIDLGEVRRTERSALDRAGETFDEGRERIFDAGSGSESNDGEHKKDAHADDITFTSGGTGDGSGSATMGGEHTDEGGRIDTDDLKRGIGVESTAGGFGEGDSSTETESKPPRKKGTRIKSDAVDHINILPTDLSVVEIEERDWIEKVVADGKVYDINTQNEAERRVTQYSAFKDYWKSQGLTDDKMIGNLWLEFEKETRATADETIVAVGGVDVNRKSGETRHYTREEIERGVNDALAKIVLTPHVLRGLDISAVQHKHQEMYGIKVKSGEEKKYNKDYFNHYVWETLHDELNGRGVPDSTVDGICTYLTKETKKNKSEPELPKNVKIEDVLVVMDEIKEKEKTEALKKYSVVRDVIPREESLVRVEDVREKTSKVDPDGELRRNLTKKGFIDATGLDLYADPDLRRKMTEKGAYAGSETKAETGEVLDAHGNVYDGLEVHFEEKDETRVVDTKKASAKTDAKGKAKTEKTSREGKTDDVKDRTSKRKGASDNKREENKRTVEVATGHNNSKGAEKSEIDDMIRDELKNRGIVDKNLQDQIMQHLKEGDRSDVKLPIWLSDDLIKETVESVANKIRGNVDGKNVAPQSDELSVHYEPEDQLDFTSTNPRAFPDLYTKEMMFDDIYKINEINIKGTKDSQTGTISHSSEDSQAVHRGATLFEELTPAEREEYKKYQEERRARDKSGKTPGSEHENA